MGDHLSTSCLERGKVGVGGIEYFPNRHAGRIRLEIECSPVEVWFVWSERQILEKGLGETLADRRPGIGDDPVRPPAMYFGPERLTGKEGRPAGDRPAIDGLQGRDFIGGHAGFAGGLGTTWKVTSRVEVTTPWVVDQAVLESVDRVTVLVHGLSHLRDGGFTWRRVREGLVVPDVGHLGIGEVQDRRTGNDAVEVGGKPLC